MISFHTRLLVADNSGARKIQCIKILRGSFHKTATIGDLIVVSVKKARALKKLKKGEVRRAVVVRTAKVFPRLNGTSLLFEFSSAVVINNQLNPIGTRLFGPFPKELRGKKLLKVLSMAPSVL